MIGERIYQYLTCKIDSEHVECGRFSRETLMYIQSCIELPALSLEHFGWPAGNSGLRRLLNDPFHPD